MSELAWDAEPHLERPILVVALAGLFDAGSAATGATSWLTRELGTEPLAHIDPEQFFDFHEALAGVEPHLRWRTFTDLVRELATGAGVEMVVTLGATPAQAPHTRPPVVFGS